MMRVVLRRRLSVVRQRRIEFERSRRQKRMDDHGASGNIDVPDATGRHRTWHLALLLLVDQ